MNEEIKTQAVYKAPVPLTESLLSLRGGLDFYGLLFYIFVEYTRIAAMYPALAPLQLGKVSLLLALLGVLTGRSETSANGNRQLRMFLMLLAIFTLFSGIAARYIVVPVGALWNMPEQIIIAFLVGRAVVNPWRQKRFVFLIMLLMLKVAQHGLRSYGIGHSKATNEMAFVSFGIVGGGGSFYANSADLGVAMAVTFGLGVALSQANLVRKWHWFFILCTAAFGAMILVCGSRGAIVGGAAVVLAAFVRSARKGWAIVVLALFVLGLIFLMPNASRERFQSAEDYKNDTTANHRVELWKAGLRMWRDNPLLGVGPANFAQTRKAYYRINVEQERDAGAFVCHSLYIEVISELGTLGMVAVAGILFTFFSITGKLRKKLREMNAGLHDWEFCLATGLQLAMIGYLVSGAFVSVFWYPHIWILAGLAMGLNSSVMERMALATQQANREVRLETVGAHAAI